MLYRRWREIARMHSADLALVDLTSGMRWTFAQLAAAVDSGGANVRPSRTPGELVCPSGQGADFIFTVLEAWRDGRPVCPLEPGQSPPEIRAALPSGCVHLKSTSASTGAARGVAFTAEQLAADAANIVITMGLRPEWPNLAVISLAHSYGFSNLVLPLLLHGIPLVLADAPWPETIRRAAALTGVLTLPAVPALWRAWHDARVLSDRVRLAISAGAPLPLALEVEIFESTGTKVHNFYGSTECGGIAFDRTRTPRADTACAGEPMCGVGLSVADDGCLVVQGAAVGTTYWPVSDERLGAGRFHTADLAEVRDGQVFLRGRAGDQINVAGRKIVPESIETALLAHPGVRACLVFGVPSDSLERVEDIVAAVVSDLSEAELKSFLGARLPSWQVPRSWWFIESLAPNQRGKLPRAEWRRKFLEARNSG